LDKIIFYYIKIFFLLSFLGIQIFPQQNIKFDRITSEDGLSQSSIFCIMQDSKGFLWFGTQGGLHKYDGYKFTVYKYHPFDSTSLSDNWVTSLVEDRDGVIWVGTYSGGIFSFDRHSKAFTNYRNDPSNFNSLNNNRVWSLYEDKDGFIWIGTSGGLNKLDKNSKLFSHFNSTSSRQGNESVFAVNAIYEDTNGMMWLGTWGGGLVKFDRKEKTFRTFLFSDGEFTDNRIKVIHPDRDGNLWLGMRGEGLLKFNIENESYTRYTHDPNNTNSISNNSIIAIVEDRNENLWLGTHNGGLNKFDKKNNKFYRFVNDARDPLSLCNNWVQAVYEDRSGIIWIGTGDGINKYSSTKQVFENVKHDPDAGNTLASNDITSIYEDKNGIIWIGTWNSGLIKFNRKENHFKTFKSNPNNNSSLPGNIVTKILEDSRGNFWIGTTSALARMDRDNEKFISYRNNASDPNSLSFNNISEIFEDSDKDLWIGTWGGGLNLYSHDYNTFKSFAEDPNDENSLSDNIITSITEGNDKKLYIGTNAGGLNVFDKKTGKFIKYSYNPQDRSSISNNSINTLYTDSKGNIWIGTLGGGLNKLNAAGDKFEHFTEDIGLPNNSIFGIIEDNQGIFWFSTLKGLSSYNPAVNRFTNFDMKDGLGSNEFGLGAFKCRNGEAIFGGRNGLTIFNPDSVWINTFQAPVIISSINVFNKEMIFPQEADEVSEVTLQYNQNVFSIDFAALEFDRSDKVEYAYMLQGFDKNWIYSGKRRNAYYTNLDPGSYTFLVKASYGNDLWIEREKALLINIIPPFWLTWWFISLTSVLIVLAIFAFYRYRVNRLLEMEKLRIRIASDLHDEIATNLSSIFMFSKIIQDESAPGAQKSEMLPQLLERITVLSQESVTAIRDIIWAIDPKTETIFNLLVRIRDSFISSCRAKNIALNFNIPAKEYLPATNLSPEQRKNLWLLLKEALSNSVKHSCASELNVTVLHYSGLTKITIKDDGKGFNMKSSSRGKGLGTMKKRAEALKGDFEMISAEGKGTTIKIAVSL
jgi:ligand-binding sensor domain-containing protein/signal transduction histidine kinase